MRQKPGKRREATGDRKSEPIVHSPSPTCPPQSEGRRGIASAEGAYANGDFDCPAMHKRIDNTICVLFSWRYPKSCEGCTYKSRDA